MKIYIKCNSTNNVFTTSTTGMSYYDDFLNSKDTEYLKDYKNLQGEIVMMSPNDYYKQCSENVFNKPVESLKRQREASKMDGVRLVDKYKNMMASGIKFDMCVLDLTVPTQEGLHRMYSAGELCGWDTKFPVLVVTYCDENRAKHDNTVRELNSYIRYNFKYVCKATENKLSDLYWREPKPDNMISVFKDTLVDLAKTSSSDWDSHYIDVVIESKLAGKNIQYACWISEFDGIERDLSYKTFDSADYISFEADSFGWCSDYNTSDDDSDGIKSEFNSDPNIDIDSELESISDLLFL